MAVQHLSQPKQIGEKTAPNRFAILPAEQNCGDFAGAPSELSFSRYTKLAEGKAGIVFSEAAAVDRNGRARKNQLCLMDETAPRFERLVKEMRRINEDFLFIIQLDHAGSLGDPAFSKPVAVYPRDGGPAHVLSVAEIEDLGQKFVRAAVLAEKIGADGIDIKHAHGFLGNEFLQPANIRDDAYGGSFENRTRFFRRIVQGIRSEVANPGFLLGVRVSAYEGLPGGFGTTGPGEVIEDLAEPIRFAKLAESEGLDYLSVSAGNAAGNLEILLPSETFPEGTFRHFGWTRAIKKAVGLPVVGAGYTYLGSGRNNLAGGDASRKSILYWAEKNIGDGNVDFVGLGRQAIADPLFPQKALAGETKSIHFCKPACGGCGMLLGAQENTGCVVYDDHYRKIKQRLDGQA